MKDILTILFSNHPGVWHINGIIDCTCPLIHPNFIFRALIKSVKYTIKILYLSLPNTAFELNNFLQ